MSKHFAIIVDYPEKGQMMMFCDYYENMKQYIDENYEEVNLEEYNDFLAEKIKGQTYKAFKKINKDGSKD